MSREKIGSPGGYGQNPEGVIGDEGEFLLDYEDGEAQTSEEIEPTPDYEGLISEEETFIEDPREEIIEEEEEDDEEEDDDKPFPDNPSEAVVDPQEDDELRQRQRQIDRIFQEQVEARKLTRKEARRRANGNPRKSSKPKRIRRNPDADKESKGKKPESFQATEQSRLILDEIIDIIEDLLLAQEQALERSNDEYRFESERKADEAIKKESQIIIDNLDREILTIEANNDVNPKGLEVEYYDDQQPDSLKNILYRVPLGADKNLEINVDFRENGTKESYLIQIDYTGDHLSKQVDVGYHDDGETVSDRKIVCIQSEVETVCYAEFEEDGVKSLNSFTEDDIILGNESSDVIEYQEDGKTPKYRENYSFQNEVEIIVRSDFRNDGTKEQETVLKNGLKHSYADFSKDGQIKRYFEFYEDGKTLKKQDIYYRKNGVEKIVTFEFRQEDSTKEYKTVTKNGVKQSDLEFYEDGKTPKKLNNYYYKNDIETVVTFEFRQNGTQEYRTVTKDGRKSSYAEFYKDGKTMKKLELYSYKNGVVTVTKLEFRQEDGTKEYKTVTKNGQKVSYAEFYKDGKTKKKLEAYSYKDGIETVTKLEFRQEDGTKEYKTVTKNGQKVSYAEFYKDGKTMKKLEAYSYKDGIETVTTSKFRTNGTRERETVLKDGIKYSYAEFNKNGKIEYRSIFYEDGKTIKTLEAYSYDNAGETKTTTGFRDNETKEYETVCKNGKRQTHLELHKDGQTAKKYITYSYDYGVEELAIVEYRQDGNRKSDASFFDGEEMSAIFYRRDGQTKLLERFCDYKEGVKQFNLVRFKSTSEIKTPAIKQIASFIGRMIGLRQRQKVGVDNNEIKEFSAVFVNLQARDSENLEKVFTNPDQYPTEALPQLLFNKFRSKLASLTLYRKDEELPFEQYDFSNQGGVNRNVKTKFRKRGTKKSERIEINGSRYSLFYKPNGVNLRLLSKLKNWVKSRSNN